MRAAWGLLAPDLVESTPVCSWVFEHARRTPHAPALDSPEHRLDYGTLARRIAAAARVLGGLGVGPEARVVSALPNVPAAVVVSLAVEALGGVNVEVSREWTAEQLALVLAQTRGVAFVFSQRDAAKLAPLVAASAVRSVVVVGGLPDAPLRAGLSGVELRAIGEAGELSGPDDANGDDSIPRALPTRDPDGIALLLYTSGSTGSPRAVMQTVKNIAVNTRSIVQYLGLTSKDRAMLILPLSYCYGRSVLQTHLFVGGSVFLDRRFAYPRIVLDAIGSERCTGFAGVPLTFELLRRRAGPDPASMPCLRYVTQAGGRMNPETIDWARAAFRPAELYVMYGQTEATARLAYLPPSRAVEKRGAIGIPIPGVELSVVDDEGGEVGPGIVGHLIARGPNVTPGYLDDPAATAAILRDGSLWTMDLAHRDADGFFFHVGRARDIIKIGGRRVSPAQIEGVLRTHRDVQDLAVVGIPDPLTGEAVAALVVPRPGATVTEGDLRQYCGERLPAYLVPRALRLVQELPRSASGKVLRGEVVSALRQS